MGYISSSPHKPWRSWYEMDKGTYRWEQSWNRTQLVALAEELGITKLYKLNSKYKLRCAIEEQINSNG